MPVKLDEIATAFGPYIEELHGLFENRGIEFGNPKDVVPFTRRLKADASFRDEMGSMVRAVMYRERDGMAPPRMVNLLVAAVGGAEAEHASDELREPVRQILDFVSGAFRSRWATGAVSAGFSDEVREEVELVDKRDALPNEPVREEFRPGPNTVFVPIGPPGLRAEESQPAAAPGEAPKHAVSGAFGKALVANRVSEAVAEPGLEPGGGDGAGAGPARPFLVNTARPEPAVQSRPATSEPPREPKELPADVRFAERVAALQAEAAAHPEWYAPAKAEPKRNLGMWAAGVAAVAIAVGGGMFIRSRVPAERALPMNARPAPEADLGSGDVAAAPVPEPTATVPTPADSSSQSTPQSLTVAKPRPERYANTEPAESTLEHAASIPVAKARPRLEAENSAPTSQHPLAVERAPANLRNSGLEHGYAPGSLFGISSGIMAGHLLYAPAPDYPKFARLAHVEGQVVVEAVVAKDGHVAAADVVSGHHLLRGAALKAIRSWRYRPYAVNGRPTVVETIVTVNFSLQH